MFRKLYFKIKRFFFKNLTGLNPEDIRKLVYVQKYLDKVSREANEHYLSYLGDKEFYNGKQ